MGAVLLSTTCLDPITRESGFIGLQCSMVTIAFKNYGDSTKQL